MSEETEGRRDGLEGTDAYLLASTVDFAKVVVHQIQRVDWVSHTAKGERDIEILTAWNQPPLVFSVIDSTANPSVDRVGHIARNLREGKSTVDDGNICFGGGIGYNRLDLNGVSIGPHDTSRLVGQRLPMLV